MAGIVSYGAYVPLFRLGRGTAGWEEPAERGVANFDEDSVTMAVAALRGALTAMDALEFITIWVILCLARKEAQAMLRYRDLPAHTSEVLDLTSLTVDEFMALVPPFEDTFLGYMADWTLDGRRRQARRDTTDKNCPLPTPEDRLWFILVYLKQNPTQLLHGRVFGMRQSKATQWIHVFWPV